MSTTSFLESFASNQSEQATIFLARGKLEDAKQAAQKAGYDQGYQEACTKMEACHSEAIRDMAAAFHDHEFSHTEARRTVLDSLQPLIEKLVDVILPEMAHLGFADVVFQQVNNIASSLTDGPVILRCPETYRAPLEELVRKLDGPLANIVVISDSDLGPTEVRLTSPQSELHIDIDTAIESIRDSVLDFYTTLAQRSV